MVRRIRCIFRAILGGWSRQKLWRSLCGDLGDIFVQFNGCGILDTGHPIGPVLSIGAAVECVVPAILMSHCSLHWRAILCTRPHAQLFRNQLVSFALYIWNSNRYVEVVFHFQIDLDCGKFFKPCNPLIPGIGGGLSTTPGIIIVSMYFNKRRALANGICVSGTAAGSFVFPILIEYLIQKFGFHATLLLLGAGMLHVCVSATLYRPLDTSDSTETTTTPKSITKCENSINSTATNLTVLTTCSNNGDAKRYIEHLFMEESKNRLIDIYNTNKLGEHLKAIALV